MPTLAPAPAPPLRADQAAMGENPQDQDDEALIPGLPDDIAELCLLRIPYPYQPLARSVSSSWNKLINHPSFLLSRTSLSLSLPYLFVFAFQKSTARVHWQALDPRSGCWFILPPMPCPKAACPPAFACVSMPLLGKLFVLGGMCSDTEAPIPNAVMYQASLNRWSVLSPMRTPRAFFACGVVDGKIVAAGGSGPDLATPISAVECYDPEEDTWGEASEMQGGLVKYDSVVVGSRMYVTEGWTWPFMFSPRGAEYDRERDTWQEMRAGMREGWTGMCVRLNGRLFVMSEHGDHRMKVYDPERDTWSYVGGDKFPREDLEKPYAVTGGGDDEGRIYVVASGLKVGVGTVSGSCHGKCEFVVEWRVMAAPKAFRELSPCTAEVLYI